MIKGSIIPEKLKIRQNSICRSVIKSVDYIFEVLLMLLLSCLACFHQMMKLSWDC